MSTDAARIEAAARRALDALNDLIANTTDPGVEALGARFELSQALIGAQPSPVVNRVTAYREAADICDEAGGAYTARALNDHAAGAFSLMEHFLRKANEAEFAATPCDPMVPCEDGGEPCHTHERLLGHMEGDHCLCGDECPAPRFTSA
jgi:hypothetical protein